MTRPIVLSLMLLTALPLGAADVELSETVQLPECHSLGWVRRHTLAKGQTNWNGVLDEQRWGTPSPQQVVARNWDLRLSDEQWREAVKAKGEGKREEVGFELWIPAEATTVRGIVAISGHGSGTSLYRHESLRALARELNLALFKFIGNPMQRGFWPRRLLFDRLRDFGARSNHPELEHAPMFLYGHSNGTGFSAIFTAGAADRVWGWVSMRPGTTFQVYQPGAARVPGLVIFGENDHFLARPSVDENLAIVPAMRKNHDAVWSFAVEPKTGHGPGAKTWPLVFSFLRHSFHARVPPAADPARGPVKLMPLKLENGCLGANWQPKPGGYQALAIAPFNRFTGDKQTASWLINEAFATDWQTFQAHGTITPDEKQLGFVSLFDGRTFNGWKHGGNWAIEDGAFYRRAKGGSLTYTNAVVPDDFELRFEWKVSKGCNSGVYYRPRQYEFQILDNVHSPYGENPRQAAGSLFFCMAPSRDATKPFGQWNTGRVKCQGTVIEHWINGERVLSFDYRDPKWSHEVELLRIRGANLDDRGGRLWLQDHGQDVWFRNLRWRQIPAGETVLPDPDFQPLPVTGDALKKEQARVQRMLQAQKKPR